MPKINIELKEYMKPDKCHLSDKGYLFRIINGKRIYLHIEVVHHKDGNILNNNIENLEVINQSIHFSNHLKENKFYKNRKHNHNKYSKGILGKTYKKKTQVGGGEHSELV